MCYEWARMNLAILDGFFEKLAKDNNFRKWICTYYKADEGPEERLDRMKVVMDASRKRAAFYSLTKMKAMPLVADEERLVPNLSWRGQLTPIPGIKTKQRGRRGP